MLLLIKKHTDTFNEQTKSRPQITREIELIRQMDTLSFSPPINFSEEGEWLLAVTSFEVTISVFNIIDENNGFSLSTLRYWSDLESFEEVC